MGVAGAAALLLSASVALAEDAPTTGATASQETAKPAAVEKAQAARDRAKEKGQAAREEKQARRAAVASTTAERVKEARDKAEGRAAEMRQKAEDRMAAIQDKAKQQMAKRLATQFTKLNETWTDRFAKLLDRYTAIADKMVKRADAAAAKGRDVTAANTAITAAQAAIESARTAVAAQAAKTFTLDTAAITTTASSTPSGQQELVQKVKAQFQALHASLFQDLFALRDGPMKSARETVQSALQALGAVPRVDEGKAPTATTTSSN